MFPVGDITLGELVTMVTQKKENHLTNGGSVLYYMFNGLKKKRKEGWIVLKNIVFSLTYASCFSE